MKNVKIYDTPEEVAVAASDYLHHQIVSCVKEKGVCHVVLPGGSTPARCLQLLSSKDSPEPLPWEHIHWYPGDERCYTSGHEERNDTMIERTLFADLKDVNHNFHPIPAELGPDEGAKMYAELLDEVGQFDIVVLGMGEDGHTASLFPGNEALQETASAVAVYNSPKAPATRVSMSLNVLKNAGESLVIATGRGKRSVLEQISKGAKFPITMVEPDGWYLDKAAVAG